MPALAGQLLWRWERKAGVSVKLDSHSWQNHSLLCVIKNKTFDKGCRSPALAVLQSFMASKICNYDLTFHLLWLPIYYRRSLWGHWMRFWFVELGRSSRYARGIQQVHLPHKYEACSPGQRTLNPPGSEAGDEEGAGLQSASHQPWRRSQRQNTCPVSKCVAHYKDALQCSCFKMWVTLHCWMNYKQVQSCLIWSSVKRAAYAHLERKCYTFLPFIRSLLAAPQLPQ